ncbi:MAG: hypothetical protein OEX77_04655, partial [Candidatus Bathyarchaeota archaeon]|nr:hypothetical protein [Candidatus Bathyarchaeota archaeon]
MSRIKDFLKMYSSKSTIRAYKWALTEFFKVVYGENENRLDERGDRYFRETRNYEEDIQTFLVAIKDSPPKSIKLMLTAVR